jgi:N-acetylneuraminic acid mutarotase
MGSIFTTDRHLGLVGTNLVGDDGFTAAGYCWNEKAPMPTPRAELSSAVVNGRIYVIGGTEPSRVQPLNTLEEYDPLTDTWTTKAPMPTGRSQHSSVVVNGIIYVLGGNYVEAASNEGVVEAYDPATDTWSVEPPLAYGRFRHASCVVEGRYIVVAGGKRPDALFSATQVLAYDTATGETFEFTDRMPHAQWECSGTRVGNSFYLLGDLSGTSFRGTNSEFDLTTFTWTMKTNMPTARCNLTSSELNGLVYAIGGRNYSGKLRTVEAYDPATDTWTTRTPTERPRSGSTSAAVNGKIYVIGGYADGFNAPSSSVEEYDPAKE